MKSFLRIKNLISIVNFQYQENNKLLITKKDIKNMWGENIREIDEKFKIWSNAPENPQDN